MIKRKQGLSTLITILVVLTQLLTAMSGGLTPNVAYAAAAAPVSVQPPKPVEAVAERRSDTGALQAATHQATPELVHTTAPEVVAAAAPAAPLLQSGAVAVGNTVWKDLNANGLQDSGEPGIAGVTVGLYDASGNAVLCPQAGRYDTYLDKFSTTGNTNSNGTLDWSSKAWVQTNTSISGSSGNPGGSLQIYGGLTTYYATRPVDLSVFASRPTLSFDYYMAGSASKFNIQYSSNGGTSFTTLAVLSDNNSAYKTITYTLPITVANAQIRIQGQGAGTWAYFDNVKVQGQLRYPTTTTTDSNGHYTFTSANCVQPSTTYQARIDTTQNALFGLTLTSPNADDVTSNDPTGDNHDSDATVATIAGNLYAVFDFTTPALGANDSYDVGFTPVPVGAIKVNKTVNGATASSGWQFLLQSSNCSLPPFLTNPASTTTGAGGSVTFVNLLVKNNAGQTCQYQVLEQGQSGWFLDYFASAALTDLQVTANLTTTVAVVNNQAQTPQACNMGGGDVGGLVFQDFNMNGQQDSTTAESAYKTQGTIVVRAYGKDNQLLAQTQLQSDGTYRFGDLPNLMTDGVRIEFQILPAADVEPTAYTGATSTTNRTSGALTRFIQAPTCNVDLGVNRVANYCQANPPMGVPNWYYFDPALGGNGTGNGGFTTFNFDGSGTPQQVAQDEQIGATWGVAYQQSTKTIFTSAFTREFVGYGPLGRGGIYAINVSNPNSPQVSSFVDLQALGGDADGVGARPASVATETGKNSLGDIDISEDGKTLYVMNVYQRELVLLDIASKTVTQKIPVSDPGCLDSRTLPAVPAPQDRRPWAIDVQNGEVYIGVICSAETSQSQNDLRAYVMRLRGNSFVPVFNFAPTASGLGWQPWTSTISSSPTYAPIFADFEFDTSGSLIVDLLSRTNFIGGAGGAGSGALSTGAFVRYANVNGQLTATSPLYFPFRYFGTSGHENSAVGGIAFHPASGQVVATSLPGNNTNSIVWYDASSGTRVEVPGDPGRPRFLIIQQGFYKGTGLGDLEILCDQAPLEIGNRVWSDTLPNGIQDPNEPGIPDVQVLLYNITGTVLATATTNLNGEYYFNSNNVPGGLKQNTDYTIRIRRMQTALGSYNPTLLNQVINNAATPEEHDSDGDPSPYASYVSTSVHTGSAGQNNYSYDFGFVPVAIGNRVWRDTNANGLQESGEPGIAGVTLGLYDSSGNAVMCPQVGWYDTYLDQFSTTANTNSNGTLDWSSKAWVQTNTSIIGSSGNPGGSLQIYGASTAYYATRPVDLSVFASQPTLSFDYNMLGSASKFNIQYSSNGGTSFTTLAVLSDNNNGYKTINYTLPITVANAQIRIQGQGTGNWAYFDNVKIQGQMGFPVTTVTDSNGRYTFSSMQCVQPSTSYQVRIDTTQNSTKPLFGLFLTTQNAGGVTSNDPTGDDTDSDAVSVTGASTAYARINATSPVTGTNYSYDFGFVPVEIGDRVWKDLNVNGLQDSGEPGIPGVTVGLYDSSGNIVMCPQVGRYDTYLDQFSTTGTTNSNGTLDWSGKAWVQTNTSIVTTNGNPGGSLQIYGGSTAYYATRPVDLSVFASQPTLSFDYNMQGTASKFNIQYSNNGGTSFTTLAVLSDNNGAYKTITYTLPITVANAQIRIQGQGTGTWAYFDNLKVQGQLSVRYPVTTVTDSNGKYYFTGVNCVQSSTAYQVRIDMTQTPANPLFGLFLTPQNAGGMTSNDPTSDDSDSDASMTTISGKPNAVISLTAPATGVNYSYDFGLIPVEIGNYVWKDTNANGLQDSGEPPIAGVTVGLYDSRGNAVLCPQAGRYDTYLDQFSTTGNTNSNGTLDWSSKAWVQTNTSISGSSGNPGGSLQIYGGLTTYYATRPVDLSVFASQPTLSFDYYMAGSASKFNIQYSSNGGTSFTTLAVLSDNNSAYKTITYTLPITVANAQIRIQGQGVGTWAYFDNVKVQGQLRYPVTTLTDANGLYTFTGAQCVQPSTPYQIRFVMGGATPLAGLVLTLQDADGVTSNDPTADDNDSDAKGMTRGYTQYAQINAVAPAAGVNYAYDAGFVPVEIGNYVWKDNNANGLQDSGEPGIAGVTVTLHDSSGNPVMCVNGVGDTYLDQFSTTGNTNNDGTLDWSSKAWVQTNTSIVTTNGNPGGALQIYGGSTAYYATRPVDLSVFASQPTLRFDYNMAGVASKFNIQYSSNGGTSFTTLAVLSDNNSTYKTITYTLPITVANAQIRIQGQGTGNYGYFDNVTIRGLIAKAVSTTTANTGFYSFDGYDCLLTNTAYQVRLAENQTPLTGLFLTSQNAGGVTSNDPTADDSDSDAQDAGAYAVIALTSPVAGQNYSYDFGFTPDTGTILIRKATTLMGSSQSFSFISNVLGYTSFTLRDGESYTMTKVPVGTYAVTETLPAGWTQAASACTNVSMLGNIQVTKGITTTCRILNAFQPTTSNVLTVTKTVNWNGNTPTGQPFAINITGPSFPSGKADTITAGQTKVYTNVVAGVYTVTETSPGAGWVATYSVPSGVVNLSGTPVAATTAGPISGNVFRDFNADGVDAGTSEPGVAGVTVTAYDPKGVVRGSATTAANGNYSFTPTGSGPYRVELSNLPAGYYPSTHGSGNGTGIQFVTTNGGATNVNFGVNDPVDYSQSNPNLVTNLYVNGDSNNATAPTAAIVAFPYNASGVNPVGSQTTLATKAQVGSTFGLAYHRSTKTIYASAFLKRHVGLGPNGLGAIYAIPTTGGTPVLFADLAALGVNVGTVPSNGARGLGAPNATNADAVTTAPDQVGGKGLGDLDISDDGRTLYVTSLNDQKLYALKVPGGTLAGSYAIPNPCDPIKGVGRPFGLKYKNGAMYVGGVCDAEISQNASDLSAYVYRFDGAGFTQIFMMPLNYGRGTAHSSCGQPSTWRPWNSNLPICGGYIHNPQPILSDIEFDVDGSLLLGFIDRSAAETAMPGTEAGGNLLGLTAGDIVRACNINGTLVAEGNSGCSYHFTGSSGNEFYWDSRPDNGFQEIMLGGLALLPGSGEVVSTATDPASSDSLGVMYNDNTTGAVNRRYNVVYSTNVAGAFIKGDGLGDLELLANPAPLEIGNRVWKDLNGNGVQDPGEPGIANVTVALQSPTNTVTTNTDANGLYYFNVIPNMAYTLTISPSQAPLSGLSLTQVNMQAISGSTFSNDPFLDTRDSDAVPVNGKATIIYTTGSAGQNNHGLDFGWSPTVSGKVIINNKAPHMDWGDNPDQYDTTITNTGAAHLIVPGLYLGAGEDSETDGQPTAAANGDGADEDGVQFPLLKAGSTAVLTVTATNTGTTAATIYGWIDFNGDGKFAASERVTKTVPAGTTNGLFYLTYNVPANVVRATYARFRLSTDPAAAQPTGVALNGEVEDYPVTIEAPFVQFGDRVWLESDTDGLASTGVITPIVGLVITATDSSGVARTATTNNAGYYSFTVPVGTYTVTYGSVPVSYGVTAPSATPGGSSEAGNAGSYRQSGLPDQSHANGTTVTVTDGQANWHIDFAFHNLVQIGNRLWIETDSDGDATTGSVTPVVGQVVTATSRSGVVYTATTDSNGLYTISVPANAVYTVTTSTPAGNTPSVYSRTPGDNQSHKPSGTRVVVGVTDDLTIDFGFHALLAQFGDRVWLESDADGLVSTGVISPIVGIVITATDGTQTYTATTTAQGYYSFTVPPGLYTVSYGSVPAQYGTLLPSATPGGGTAYGNEGRYQETGNPDENYTNPTYVGLATGETNWHVDFAFHVPQADLHLVKWVDKTIAKAGDMAVYTLVLTNDGPDAATDVQVKDLLPALANYQSATPQQGTYDTNTGVWDVGALPANSSVTLIITVKIK